MALSDKNIASETFWLNLAAENIYESFKKRETSVKNLKTWIEWTFGLFTTTGFVISVFGPVNKFTPTSLVCFGIAFFLLTISYSLAGQAQYPIKDEYHPNDISEIASAFSRAVRIQSSFFKWAAGITLVGFFSFALGILFLFFNAKKPAEKVEVTINPLLLNASVEKKDNKYFIPISVITSPDSKVDLTIAGDTATKKILFSRLFSSDADGRISYSHPLDADTLKTFIVRAGIQKSKGDTTTERSTTIKIAMH